MSGNPSHRSSSYRLARLLVVALMLPFLVSCVTYYYPATAQSDGVYYAKEDTRYVRSSVNYAGAAYYPWWSVDYFYLGYGYYGSGISVGLSFGYPWRPGISWAYYPFGYASWYYDPWRVGWWNCPPYYRGPWRGYPRYNAYWHVNNRTHRDRMHDSYGRHAYQPYASSRNRGRERYRYDEPADGDFGRYRSGNYGRDETGSWNGTGAVQRRVSVAPGSASSDRGMVIANRDGGKWSRSRLEPVGRPAPARANDRASSNSIPDRSRGYETVRMGTTTVRRASGSKVGPSRITPNSPPGAVVTDRGQRSPVASAAPSYERSVQVPNRGWSGARPAQPAPAAPVSGAQPGSLTGRSSSTRFSAPPPRSAPASRPPARSSVPSRKSSGKSGSRPQPASRSSKGDRKRDR